VFGGHNHYYACAEVNGVIYITTGGGDAPLITPDPSYPNVVTALGIITLKALFRFAQPSIRNG
jgi:hypothetical protein